MARRSFAVIGLGRFGAAMATTLTELGQEVIGIDSDEEPVQRLAGILTQATRLDATDARALRDAGVADVDVAIVSIGENIEASLLIVVQLMDLGVREIIAKAVTAIHGKILHKLGVTRVIYPEREMAIRVAHSLVMPRVVDYFELSRDCSVVELPAPADWVGKTIGELAIRQRFGLTIIAIRRHRDGVEQATLVSPGIDERIGADDIVALLGNNERLAAFERRLGRA